MNTNTKTHIHMNKFTKATIKTYNKNNPILASKHTLGSFQIILCIDFLKAKFIWKPFITSTIFIGLSCHCAKEDIPSPTQKKNFLQHKRKQKKEWTKEVDKAFMLPCQLGVKSS